MGRGAMVAGAILLAGCSGHPAVSPHGTTTDASGSVVVTLSDFAFGPERLALRVGQSVRLRLVNSSSGGHNFSAPAFFAASDVEAGPRPVSGTVEVAKHGVVELTLTPLVAGHYDVECTHPLHALFGMTGSIDVATR